MRRYSPETQAAAWAILAALIGALVFIAGCGLLVAAAGVWR